MSLILDRSTPGMPRIAAVRCDRCKAVIHDPIDLGEVLHIRLHAGFGSAWGDGSLVSADLCDACGHALLQPFATVEPDHDALRGPVVTGGFAREMAALRAWLDAPADADDAAGPGDLKRPESGAG